MENETAAPHPLAVNFADWMRDNAFPWGERLWVIEGMDPTAEGITTEKCLQIYQSRPYATIQDSFAAWLRDRIDELTIDSEQLRVEADIANLSRHLNAKNTFQEVLDQYLSLNQHL